MYERDNGPIGGGGGGGSNPAAPRASVALTAEQWSAITLAVTHGARVIQESKSIPLAVISSAMRNLTEATEEIARRLGDEARRRAK